MRQARRDPGAVPEVYHFDETQALIVMEFLSPHKILRRKLIDGETVGGLGGFLGRFCARTAFRGSELSMKSADKKADVGLFFGQCRDPGDHRGSGLHRSILRRGDEPSHRGPRPGGVRPAQ
ncbi:hypothetical protein QW131_00390 [Roseibium salinum]|nr:hypothetical protein [Roseibium salinum]